MTNAWNSLSAVANLWVFCHKLDVEFLQTSQHFDNHLLLWQDGRPRYKIYIWSTFRYFEHDIKHTWSGKCQAADQSLIQEWCKCQWPQGDERRRTHPRAGQPPSQQREPFQGTWSEGMRTWLPARCCKKFPKQFGTCLYNNGSNYD